MNWPLKSKLNGTRYDACWNVQRLSVILRDFLMKRCQFYNLFEFVVCNRTGTIGIKQLIGSSVHCIGLAEDRLEGTKLDERNQTAKTAG